MQAVAGCQLEGRRLDGHGATILIAPPPEVRFDLAPDFPVPCGYSDDTQGSYGESGAVAPPEDLASAQQQQTGENAKLGRTRHNSCNPYSRMAEPTPGPGYCRSCDAPLDKPDA